MIFVFKYAVNRSLEYHLKERSRSRCITWEQRIKICLGAARGLNYLHSGLGVHFRVIHRDVKSGNILLDENMEAQVCDFGLSKSGSKGQQHSEIHTNVAGTDIYMDPNYRERSTLTKESDVYSLGVVMFEMLSGMLAYWRKNIGEAKLRSLLNLVRRYYENNEVEKLIDPHIRDQIPEIQYLDPQIEDNVEISSFYTFIDIAYKCISLDLKERPSMKEIISRFETALHNHKKHTTESMVYLLANLLVLDFLTKLGTEFECERKKQLMEYAVKLYGIISDHLKEELGSVLDLHTQAIMRCHPTEDFDDFYSSSKSLSTWLTKHLLRLKKNYVPPIVIKEIFTQLFENIDVHLFNRDTLTAWWSSNAKSLGAYKYEVRSIPILGHVFVFIELYDPMVDKLGMWSTDMNMITNHMNPSANKSTFQCLSQKHLDKLFDIYEEEYDLSYESSICQALRSGYGVTPTC